MGRVSKPQDVLDAMAEGLPEVDLDELTSDVSVQTLTGSPAAVGFQNGQAVIAIDDPNIHYHSAHRIYSASGRTGQVDYDPATQEVVDGCESVKELTRDEMHQEIRKLLSDLGRTDLNP